MLRRADRRRAFRQRADLLDILVGEDEIVRAGLATNVHTTCSRLGHQSDATSGADMDDVQRAAGFLGEEDGALDGLQLGHDGTRVEVVTDAGAALGNSASG